MTVPSFTGANSADAGAIAAVQVKTWRHAYVGMVSGDFLQRLEVGDRENYWRDVIATLDEGGRPWVADRGGRIVGFVACGPVRDNGHTGMGEL